MTKGLEGKMTERHKKPLGLMYLYVNTQQITHFKYVRILYVSFTSIKLLRLLIHLLIKIIPIQQLNRASSYPLKKTKTTPNLLSILKSKEVGADITSGF